MENPISDKSRHYSSEPSTQLSPGESPPPGRYYGENGVELPHSFVRQLALSTQTPELAVNIHTRLQQKLLHEATQAVEELNSPQLGEPERTSQPDFQANTLSLLKDSTFHPEIREEIAYQKAECERIASSVKTLTAKLEDLYPGISSAAIQYIKDQQASGKIF
jgi:hypothetical protein